MAPRLHARALPPPVGQQRVEILAARIVAGITPGERSLELVLRVQPPGAPSRELAVRLLLVAAGAAAAAATAWRRAEAGRIVVAIFAAAGRAAPTGGAAAVCAALKGLRFVAVLGAWLDRSGLWRPALRAVAGPWPPGAFA